MDVLAGSPVAGAVYALVNDGSSANFASATVSLAVGNIAALAVADMDGDGMASWRFRLCCTRCSLFENHSLGWLGMCVCVVFGNSVQAIWTL